MGYMGLKIDHDISGIYCDNDINDDNSGNPVLNFSKAAWYIQPI